MGPGDGEPNIFQGVQLTPGWGFPGVGQGVPLVISIERVIFRGWGGGSGPPILPDIVN